MYYQMNIKETATNECITYWTNVLNLDTFQEAKRTLIRIANEDDTDSKLEETIAMYDIAGING